MTGPDDDAIIDLMIDLMAELQGIELTAEALRLRLEVMSTALFRRTTDQAG